MEKSQFTLHVNVPSQVIFQDKKLNIEKCKTLTFGGVDDSLKDLGHKTTKTIAIGIVHQHCQMKTIQSTMPEVVMPRNNAYVCTSYFLVLRTR